ncbi:MAG TPA: trypsin-like peptidase domain-containing protein [Candidatus Acidoferrum sp.]
MLLSLRLRALTALLACAFLCCAALGDTLRITSTPPGAKVEINGIVVGTTPYVKKYPGGYFRRPLTALSGRLEHAMVARLKLPGYSIKEIVLTQGPTDWVSLNGRKRTQYFLFKGDHFETTLDPVGATFTGTIAASFPAGHSTLSPELSLEELAAATKPAVVELKGLQKMGSGFVVTETGVIATNAHVARDEGSLLVLFPNGKQLDGKVVYIDEDLDIALVKVEGNAFPHLALAAADTVRQGETVFAVGNPSDAMQFSMTKGIVSAVGKFHEAGAGTWIQTDAPINPGNSGGPLINMRGEVVGLNTSKLIKEHTSGIGFALSSSDLLNVLRRFYPTTLPDQAAKKVQPSTPKELQFDKLGSVETAALQTGSVNFTEPEGAAIYVDGDFAGNIPSTVQLPAGKHTLRVVRKGASDWLEDLTVFAGGSVKVVAKYPYEN